MWKSLVPAGTAQEVRMQPPLEGEEGKESVAGMKAPCEVAHATRLL